MLQVQRITKRYDGEAAPAVSDVSFVIPEGALFTLLGPSGCGKTTTLRCVAGLEQPDQGKITLNDTVVFSAKARTNVPSQHRSIGMVFQSYAIWPHMSVAKNMAYPLTVARGRRPRAEIAAAAQAMLERMGLGTLSERGATQLSGGQQQRLALGRALIAAPRLLLLDEPFSSLDARMRGSLRADLRRIQQESRVTTLFVTHDQAEALSISDIVAVMRDGRIEQIGPPKEIYQRPATDFVANFVGHANLLDGPVLHRGPQAVVRSPIGPLTCAAEAAGADAMVCVRPEHVLVLGAADAPSDGLNVFTGTVTTLEFLGAHQECTVDIDGTPIRLLAPADADLAPSAPIRLRIPPERCHLVARQGPFEELFTADASVPAVDGGPVGHGATGTDR